MKKQARLRQIKHKAGPSLRTAQCLTDSLLKLNWSSESLCGHPYSSGLLCPLLMMKQRTWLKRTWPEAVRNSELLCSWVRLRKGVIHRKTFIQLSSPSLKQYSVLDTNFLLDGAWDFMHILLEQHETAHNVTVLERGILMPSCPRVWAPLTTTSLLHSVSLQNHSYGWEAKARKG